MSSHLHTQNLPDFRPVHHLGWRAAAVEPRHEILQLHFVFGLWFLDEHFDGPESVRRDVTAFHLHRLRDGFKKRRGFYFNDVATALNVRDRDTAVAFGHRIPVAEVSVFAFLFATTRLDMCRSVELWSRNQALHRLSEF